MGKVLFYKRGWVFALGFLLFLGLNTSHVNAQPTYRLQEGRVIYLESGFKREIGSDLKTYIAVEYELEVTIENISPKVMQFTMNFKLKITEAYQSLYHGDGFWSSNYQADEFRWNYNDEEWSIIKTFYGREHTLTIISDVDRDTGLRIRVEKPYDFHSLVVEAHFDNVLQEEGVLEHILEYYFSFGKIGSHSDRYCEEASNLRIGDTWEGLWWRGFDVVSYSEFRDRKTIVLETEYTPEWRVQEWKLEFDQGTGLLTTRIYEEESSYLSDEEEVLVFSRYEETLLYQDVFPSTTSITESTEPEIETSVEPETTTESSIETTTEIPAETTPSYTSQYNYTLVVTEKETITFGADPAFVPGFGWLPVLLVLPILVGLRRRRA